MLNKIVKWLRSVIDKMFNKNSITKKLNVDIAVSDKMIKAIELWVDLYENDAPWLGDDVVSLELPSAIARELSTLVLLEFESEVTGSSRAEFLNEQYKSKVLKELRRHIEYGCAKGGLVFKPYVSNKILKIDFVQADNFFPTEYDSTGKCTAGIFVEQKIIDEVYYTRLEYHSLEDTTYTIENLAFKSKSKDELGDTISLGSVEGWEDIQESTTINNVESPLFGYFKIPFANTIDPQSPLGVSVYSRAVKLIEEADRMFSRILWEYEGSELAIDADITTLTTNKVSGTKLGLPALKDRLFRATGQTKDSSFYNVFSPAIRDSSLFNGLNNILKRIEFNCAIAYGTISDPNLVEKTAEEIRSSKQRTKATVSDIQTSLEYALEDTIYAMDVLTTLYKLAPIGKYETIHEWDDSILVDSRTEYTIMMQEADKGYIKKELYLMKRYGVSEEQAKEMMPVVVNNNDEE